MEARSAENHWAVHHDLAVVSHKVEFRTQFFLLNKALREVAEGRGSGRAAQARLLNSGHPIVLTPDNIRENALPRFQAWANGDVRIAAVGLLFNTVSTLSAIFNPVVQMTAFKRPIYCAPFPSIYQD